MEPSPLNGEIMRTMRAAFVDAVKQALNVPYHSPDADPHLVNYRSAVEIVVFAHQAAQDLPLPPKWTGEQDYSLILGKDWNEWIVLSALKFVQWWWPMYANEMKNWTQLSWLVEWRERLGFNPHDSALLAVMHD